MVNVIVLGDPEGDSLAESVYHALSQRLSVAAVRRGSRVEGCCDSADVLLLECEQVRTSPTDKNIVLCRRGFAQGGRCTLPAGSTVGVMRSDDAAAAGVLGQWKVPVISCGMSVTDTLTFSSLRADTASVCLQRSIPTLDGDCAEPMEIPLRLSRPYDSYALMCVVAVLLLCGRLDPGNPLLL